jgi:hypothetical protein
MSSCGHNMLLTARLRVSESDIHLCYACASHILVALSTQEAVRYEIEASGWWTIQSLIEAYRVAIWSFSLYMYVARVLASMPLVPAAVTSFHIGGRSYCMRTV